MFRSTSTVDGAQQTYKRYALRALLFFTLLVSLVPFFPNTAHANIYTDATADAIQNYQPDGQDCSYYDLDVLDCILPGLGYAIFETVGTLLAVIAWLFNLVVIKTVFGFGEFIGNSPGVFAGWGVLRDFSNILLLFGFIFMGIATILDIHSYEVKKTLPRLVIFAVLLNFSLFGASAIVDGANVLGAQLYKDSYTDAQAPCTDTPDGNIYEGGSTKCDRDIGIAGSIMDGSKVATLLDPGFNKNFSLGYYLGLSLVATILMVVLLAGAILLLIRAVVLVFLMILSPFGFAGMAIPFLEPYAKRWWNTLLSQSFFAPVYLLLIFIGLEVGATLPSASGSLAQSFSNGTADDIDMLLIFTVVIGFMIAALMAAKQLGAYGANFATNVATKAVAYPFALAGRNTVGRGAAKLGKKFDQWAGKDKSEKGRLGKSAAWALRFTGGDEVIAGGLKKVSSAKVGGFSSFDERKKESEEFEKHAKHAAHKAENEAALKKAASDIENGNEETIAAARMTIENLARNMSLHELEEVIKDGDASVVEAIGRAVTPEKFEKLIDSKDLSADKKHELMEGRVGDITHGLNYDPTANPTQAAEFAERVRSLTIKDFENIPDLLANTNGARRDAIISTLKESQVEEIRKSQSKISATVRDAVKIQRNSRFDTEEGAKLAFTGPNRMSPEQVGKLDGAVLVNPNVLRYLTPRILDAVLKENNISNEHYAKISTYISNLPANHPNRAQFEARLNGDPVFRSNWGLSARPQQNPAQNQGATRQYTTREYTTP